MNLLDFDVFRNSHLKCVMAITGGGTGAINQLLEAGGMSSFLLEATVPYGQKSFQSYLGGYLPDKFVSADASRKLAMASYLRGKSYSSESIIGLGCSASLNKNAQREGRINEFYLSVQTIYNTATWHVRLDPYLSRSEQEKLTAQSILSSLGEFIGQTVWDSCLYNEEGVDLEIALADQSIVQLMTGQFQKLPTDQSPKYLLCGSFNPIHSGHVEIINYCGNKFRSPIDLELSLQNFEKPQVDYIDLKKRMNGIREEKYNNEFMGRLYLTNSALFIDKMWLFPGTTFIVGMDTFERLTKSGWDVIVESLERWQCKFYVLNRPGHPTLSISQDIKHLVEFDNNFIGIDISSTQIRKGY